MRRFFLLVMTVGLLLVACKGSLPDIELIQTEVDFGQVPNGEIRSVNVEVRNLGTGALTIESVTTSCGCTTAKVEPTTIAPDGRGMLTVTFDSGAHGPSFVGSVVRQVFIVSNDPDESELVFSLAADVTGSPP